MNVGTIKNRLVVPAGCHCWQPSGVHANAPRTPGHFQLVLDLIGSPRRRGDGGHQSSRVSLSQDLKNPAEVLAQGVVIACGQLPMTIDTPVDDRVHRVLRAGAGRLNEIG